MSWMHQNLLLSVLHVLLNLCHKVVQQCGYVYLYFRLFTACLSLFMWCIIFVATFYNQRPVFTHSHIFIQQLKMYMLVLHIWYNLGCSIKQLKHAAVARGWIKNCLISRQQCTCRGRDSKGLNGSVVVQWLECHWLKRVMKSKLLCDLLLCYLDWGELCEFYLNQTDISLLFSWPSDIQKILII